jgi:preprotein translocase subunit SecF
MFSVLKYTKVWFLFSGTLVLGSLVLLAIWGLVPGIDFRGGNLFELEFAKPVSVSEIRSELTANGFSNAVIQPVNDKTMIIKTENLDNEKVDKFKQILADKFGESKELQFESIGPTISKELVRKAYWQVFLVCSGILLYLAFAFRKTGKGLKSGYISSWRFGTAAIIALIHDLIITIGFFVILGKFRGIEIDSLFVTALLTILGFSVHDTIVVFDRIREYLQKYPYKNLSEIIDHSINSTLVRSINTTSTLIFVLLAMLLFGGQTVMYFVLALLVGVTIGTYSSIFVASPIIYLWAKRRGAT